MSIEIKPHVFVGSSTEQLRWSRAIQLELDNDAEVTVWPQGVFKPSRSEMSSLIAEARRCDFAIFVFGPDDIALMRSSQHAVVRDNVIFEIGLFIGRLGRERVFIVSQRNSDLKIPTDLLGIKSIQYKAGAVGGGFDALLTSTRPAFRELESRMKEIGCLPPPAPPVKMSRYGMLGYSDSVRDREAQYMDTVESAESELYINGTALSIMTLNSWGKVIEKSRTVGINLLMLDPQLAKRPAVANLIETTYRRGVLRAAQLTVDKIDSRVRQLPADQRKNIKLFVTRYFMPIAAAVADPNSGHGRMVVEVIGASSSDAEYFSRPRYVLQEESTDRPMFIGYWRQIELLFSEDRATLYQFDRNTGLYMILLQSGVGLQPELSD